MPVEPTTPHHTRRYFPTWLPPRRFVAAVIAIGGMQLMVAMDLTIAIVALPKVQNELGLSDAGRSWVIIANLLTFGGLMLLGGRLGDTIGRKRAFIIGVALFTIASAMCGIAWDEGTLVVARLLKGVAVAIVAPTCFGAGGDHVSEGAFTQRRDGGVRRDGRCRLGDGPGGGRGAHRGVVAAGVFGERADRAAGALPGPHRAAGNPEGADEARRHRGCAGHVGLHRGGFRLLDGAGEGLAVGHHDRFRCGGPGRFRGVRRGGAHGREPHRAVQICSSTATGWPRSRPCSLPVG